MSQELEEGSSSLLEKLLTASWISKLLLIKPSVVPTSLLIELVCGNNILAFFMAGLNWNVVKFYSCMMLLLCAWISFPGVLYVQYSGTEE